MAKPSGKHDQITGAGPQFGLVGLRLAIITHQPEGGVAHGAHGKARILEIERPADIAARAAIAHFLPGQEPTGAHCLYTSAAGSAQNLAWAASRVCCAKAAVLISSSVH